MADSETPLLDALLDRGKVRERLLGHARDVVSKHVTDTVLDTVVRPRVDAVLGARRKR